MSNGGVNLFNEGLSAGDSATFSIQIPVGHNIEVNFGIHHYNTDGSLTYNVAVVPEPISSILFVTGGTLLAGRRLLKKNV